MPYHHKITGKDVAHPIGHIATSDPSGVTANDVQARSTWLDTTDEGTTGILLKIRNAANNAWSSVKVAYAAAAPWAGITGTPTTLAGYGITDAAADTHTHAQADVTDLVTDLAAKAPLASPALTGTPTAPTAATSTNTTQLATTAFVQQELAAVGGVSVLDDLADVDAPTPADGDVLTWNDTDGEWQAAAPASTGGLDTRSGFTITTASLADEATENGTVALQKLCALIGTMSADRACWVRFYATSAARTTDSGRDQADDPTPGAGVLFEAIFAGAGSIVLGPPALLYNNDGTPANTIYYAITNQSGATGTVEITGSTVNLEG
jgi:hypothetical protein